MRKSRWNIWRIKNRWLRAVFTALVMTPVLAAAMLITASFAIVIGIGEGAAYAWSVFWSNRDMKQVASDYWRAIRAMKQEAGE